MAYVGNKPVPQATQSRDRFVSTSNQTSFASSGYTPNFVDVFLDGIKLDSSEYTATNGSDVVLASGASTGQIMEVVAYSSFDVADIRNMTQPLGLKNYTTTERNALTGIGAGDTIFNSTTGSIEFYDGSQWISTNLIPLINSVTGTIYSGLGSTLVISITNATDTVSVRFSEGGSTIADVSGVTVTSGSASVSVPASVYGQTSGDTISVTIINVDGTPSSNDINKTVQAVPTGGTITTSGGYVYHTFTSSSSLVVPSGISTSAEYLIVAGGGSGGNAGGNPYSGAGGAGGYIDSTVSLSAQTYTITIGAGGSVNANGANSSSFGATAIGGGRGGSYPSPPSGASGGSGGGAGSAGGSYSGGSGTAGQGNAGGSVNNTAGYQAAGGGGAGAVGGSVSGNGGVGGAGGVGLNWKSLGTFRAGGGGGSGAEARGGDEGAPGGVAKHSSGGRVSEDGLEKKPHAYGVASAEKPPC